MEELSMNEKEALIILRCNSTLDYSDRNQVAQIYTEIIKRNCLTSEQGRKYAQKLKSMLTGSDTPSCFLCGERSNGVICRKCVELLKPKSSHNDKTAGEIFLGFSSEPSSAAKTTHTPERSSEHRSAPAHSGDLVLNDIKPRPAAAEKHKADNNSSDSGKELFWSGNKNNATYPYKLRDILDDSENN
ncbi:MAG: hypothetical protein IK093_00420 [Ruminiclostridium sp.]|nr:hypothetical protein [Ruminiclostridium sp.]